MSLPAPRPEPLEHFSVETFRPDHYIALLREEPERIGLPTHEASAAVYAERGPAFTGFVDGRIAVCAGIMLLWNGVGEAWALVNGHGRQHLVFVHRAIRGVMQAVIRQHCLHRLQVEIPETSMDARRWLKLLGFTFEHSALLYGPGGETYLRYSILRPKETPK